MGKSHLTTAIIEASLRPITGITGPWVRRTAVIVFHTNLVNARLPDLLQALRQNPDPQDLRLLGQHVHLPGPVRRLRRGQKGQGAPRGPSAMRPLKMLQGSLV